jgi:methionine biosynthesis protein MetW
MSLTTAKKHAQSQTAASGMHIVLRTDQQIIADLIPRSARVLDIGCYTGELLAWLTDCKGVDGRGLELRQDGVNASVQRGLSVIQGDADTDLYDYPDQAFDCVILSQTLQATHDPRTVLMQMARIGRQVIVSFPNFGYWRTRLGLLLSGRMPVGGLIPYQWYETPNIHFCTIRDFRLLCEDLGLIIMHEVPLNAHGAPVGFGCRRCVANVLAEQAIFMIKRKNLGSVHELTGFVEL